MATQISGKRKRIGDGGVSLLKSDNKKQTLFRKCHELVVKCDAEVGLVCVNPNGVIESWPDQEKVKNMIMKHTEKQSGKKMKNNENLPLRSESGKEKKIANNPAEELSIESLMSLLIEIDSKLEILDEKINMLSLQKFTADFCDNMMSMQKFTADLCDNMIDSRDFIELYDLFPELHGESLFCSQNPFMDGRPLFG